MNMIIGVLVVCKGRFFFVLTEFVTLHMLCLTGRSVYLLRSSISFSITKPQTLKENKRWSDLATIVHPLTKHSSTTLLREAIQLHVITIYEGDNIFVLGGIYWKIIRS